MVEIADIKDHDSLKDWLEALPFDQDENRRIAVTIAHRAAMRVLPVYWDWVLRSDTARENDLTALAILRANLISGVAGTWPTPLIRNAAADAARAAAFAARAAADAAAAFAAAAAADAADAARAAAAAAFAAAAAADAADAAAATDATVWENIRADCADFAEPGQRLDQTPLWRGENPLTELWLQTRMDIPEGWEFWRDWYQNALDGVKPNWDMLTEIALIEPDDWGKGDVRVNELIAEIQLKYAVAASPNAEELIVNDDGLYAVVPRSELPARTLQDVQDRLRDVIADIRRAQQQENNQYNPLVAEADLLESTMARYSDNPLRLFESCTKVVIHIGRNVSNGVLPENDNLVGDVSGDVQNSADDILNLDAEVRETIEARGKLRFDRLSDDQKAEITRIAEAVAENSVEALAEELREDAKTVEGEVEPVGETVPDRYRLGSRLARVSAHGGKAFKNVTEALILLGGVGGGVATFVWIIRILLGL